MIKTDENALICDLAETYHIYDYRSLPLSKVAAFSVGLRENSRIKMAMTGTKYTFDTLLLASILDGVNLKNWMMTKDGQEGRNRPESILNKLMGIKKEDEREEMVFDSVEAFEEMRNKLMGRR